MSLPTSLPSEGEGPRWTEGPYHFDQEEGSILNFDGALLAKTYEAWEFPCLDEEDVERVDAELKFSAYLMASSPELFDALNALYSALERWGMNAPYWTGWPLAMANAKAAIAKARGTATPVEGGPDAG